MEMMIMMMMMITARSWKKTVAQRVSVGKPEGKKPPGRPRRIWENNIKMIFKK
jgi:hypothetical protein